MMDRDTAERVARVLEYYREATGVDEWDESDDRTALYNEAHEVLGESDFMDAIADGSTKDQLRHYDDTVAEVVDAFRAVGAAKRMCDAAVLRLSQVA